MRTAHDAKGMAKAIRAALAEKNLTISRSEALEIVVGGHRTRGYAAAGGRLRRRCAGSVVLVEERQVVWRTGHLRGM